jgi:hypothetical protein
MGTVLKPYRKVKKRGVFSIERVFHVKKTFL